MGKSIGYRGCILGRRVVGKQWGIECALLGEGYRESNGV